MSDGRTTTFSLNPRFGYFVIPGLALLVNADLTRSSAEDFSSTTIGIGPGVAYFFGGPASNTYPFVAAGLAYNRTSLDLGADEASASGLGGEVSGGVTFMLARNVGLTGEAFYQAINYSSDDFGPDESSSSDAFGLRAGVTAFIF